MKTTNTDANPNLNDRRCLVCDDRAIGYNFNGLTCESCKVFFRRNANKPEKLICYKGGCVIDYNTRRSCQKCRLDKCFRIGMKKEFIKYKYTKCRPIQGALDRKNYRVKVNFPMSQEETESRKDCPTKVHNLLPHDRSRIGEIEQAISIFGNENSLPLTKKQPNLVDALNYSAFYAKKIVKFCNRIEAFKSLSTDDKLIIMRTFFCDMLWIYCGFNYSIEKDGYLIMMDETDEKAIFVKTQVFNQSNDKSKELLFRLFFHSLSLELENDATIRNLVIAFLLFKPHDGLSCEELMQYHNSVYRYLLKRYLKHKYQSAEKAERKIMSLLKLLDDLPNMNVIFKQMFTDIDSNKFNQIWNEILV